MTPWRRRPAPRVRCRRRNRASDTRACPPLDDERQHASHRLHWRLLGRLGTDVRVEETRIATLLFAYSFLIGAFQFAAKSIRQSSFVDSLGWTQLPFVYLAVAIMAWPLLRAWNRMARGVPLERFIPDRPSP